MTPMVKNAPQPVQRSIYLLYVNKLKSRTTRRQLRRQSAVRANALGICFAHKHLCEHFPETQSAGTGSETSKTAVAAMTRCTRRLATIKERESAPRMVSTCTHVPRGIIFHHIWRVYRVESFNLFLQLSIGRLVQLLHVGQRST